jgi:antitoxin component YwqK of YwqJK toxin-antitoxin module
MNTRYSKLLFAILFFILFVPPVVADGPPEDGPHVEYYDNGQKRCERHYKNGEKEGLETFWYENALKEREYHYKDGKGDGLWTYWHENGQKRYNNSGFILHGRS